MYVLFKKFFVFSLKMHHLFFSFSKSYQIMSLLKINSLIMDCIMCLRRPFILAALCIWKVIGCLMILLAYQPYYQIKQFHVYFVKVSFRDHLCVEKIDCFVCSRDDYGVRDNYCSHQAIECNYRWLVNFLCDGVWKGYETLHETDACLTILSVDTQLFVPFNTTKMIHETFPTTWALLSVSSMDTSVFVLLAKMTYSTLLL